GYSGDGGQATAAQLFNPFAVAFDDSGNMYIADVANNDIRKVTPAGIISTVAGNQSPGYSGDGGAATSAQLHSPIGVAIDHAGNLYIADSGNNVIRKVTPDDTIGTVAGNGASGYSGDGGLATSARFDSPAGIAFDRAGALYVADNLNFVIRRVALNGTISTVAGTHNNGYSGDGGPAASAALSYVAAVAFDRTGNMYIVDNGNEVIRKVALDGTISTVAGNNALGSGYSGDGGPATSAQFAEPSDAVVDGSRLYIADMDNSLIRMVVLDSIFANGFEQ
ncbi:MAG: hypothetical protein WBV39_10800, partial [Rudaea sp.]